MKKKILQEYFNLFINWKNRKLKNSMIEKENDTRLKEQDTENDNRETFV